MFTKNLSLQCLTISLLLLISGLIDAATAQTVTNTPSQALPQQQSTQPQVILPTESGPARVANKTDLYCAGFIQYPAQRNPLEIVGGEQEQEQRIFVEGDYVYINAGSQQGIQIGQEFSVIRPRGRFTSKFTKKKGGLGVFTQELGQLRVIDVKDRVSVATIKTSCEAILLGDLLTPVPQRVAPVERTEGTFDRFSDPTGKQRGRLVLARDSREMPGSSQIVFIDLGAEDNIKPGDYFTIYRPVGTGNITRFRDEEIVRNARGGYESERFKGGKFSNQAQRTTNPEGTGIINQTAQTHEIKRRRPPLPRKVVGELVVINVQARTAAAIITHVAQEVHTGDYVELQ